ncbi:MAG: hypothetical protein WBP81_28225 [Solirubrobacteraceae bacterium]
MPARRGRRLLGAAELALELGEVDLGGRLRRTVGALELEARDRVRLEWIRELSDERVVGGVERVHVLIELAEQARAGGDVDLALQLFGRAASRVLDDRSGAGPLCFPTGHHLPPAWGFLSDEHCGGSLI